MARMYKCLLQQEFFQDNYSLIPLRDEDKYAIMKWRNEQINILRQKEHLTKEKQEWYFQNVVNRLFEQEKPEQLLFSFLENDVLIGYGGLVHIDWESKNSEISFITETERNDVSEQFINDWVRYLTIIRKLAENLNLIKIYTYAYDLRPNLYIALEKSGFVEEARLKKHIVNKSKPYDVLIHSCFLPNIYLRRASSEDVLVYFKWANDELVRLNSFNSEQITLEGHKKWFAGKLRNPECVMFIAYLDCNAIGQIRFDLLDDNIYEIDFSIDSEYRGKGMGSKIIREGAIEFFNKEMVAKRVVGKVKQLNVASRKSFVEAGFKSMIDNAVDAIDVYYLDK